MVTELHGKELHYSTQYHNVRSSMMWQAFPEDCWKNGLTYEFIRIFFEKWEQAR